MRPRCLTLGILVLVFGLATPALAQGGPPAHAGSGGPPDHAQTNHGDPRPPDHARGGTADGGEGGPASTAAATEDTSSTSTDEDVEAAAEQRSRAEATVTARTANPDERSTVETDGLSEGDASGLHGPVSLATTSSSPETSSTQTSGESPPGLVAGLVPGLLLGAVGVLALAIHVGPARPETVRAAARRRRGPETAASDTEEIEEDAASAEPAPPSTEAGVAGVIGQGQRALERGQVEVAAEWFETAIELAPRLQVARFCLGMCLDDLERLEEAEQTLREARELEDDPMTAYAHASVLARLGRTREAVGILEHVTARVPEMRERMGDDEELANLRDHPRFLALLGDL